MKSLKAGKYKFAITDKSDFHNFKVEWEKGGLRKADHHDPVHGLEVRSDQLKPGELEAY